MGKLFEHAVNLLMLYVVDNREEKSLHHIVMVAKFLVNNKSKHLLKSGFALFQTSSMLSCLIYVSEIFWVESERTISKFRKRNKIFVSSGLSKVASCQRKSPPICLVSASYSAWHFFTGGIF